MEISERVSGAYNHPEGVAAALIGLTGFRTSKELDRKRISREPLEPNKFVPRKNRTKPPLPTFRGKRLPQKYRTMRVRRDGCRSTGVSSIRPSLLWWTRVRIKTDLDQEAEHTVLLCYRQLVMR